MNNITEYKFILLLNNDFIFSKIEVEKPINGFLKLINPLRVLMSEDDESVSYNFIPWIPFTKDTVIPLASKSIVTITSLSEEHIDLYNKAIENITEIFNSTNKSNEEHNILNKNDVLLN